MNDPRNRSSLMTPTARYMATLLDPFARLDFAINSWASRRLIERGPEGRPLYLLGDRLAARLFSRSRTRGARLQRLDRARTTDELIDSAEDALHSNQKRDEITRLLEAVREISPENVLEIGVAGGGTNLLLSRAASTVKFVGALDLYVRNKAQLSFFAPKGQERLYIDAPSAHPGTVDTVAQALGRRKLDVLFIDGDHSYEGARRDFELYSPFVRDGGIIAFHDIVPDEVTRTGTFTGNWVGEVPRLWSELKASYPDVREFIADPRQDGYGIGIIYFDSSIRPRFERP